MFIPTTAAEVKERGWKSLDIILVSGDTYLDNSYNGSAVIGHWLIANGFRVGIICQPDLQSNADITRLGQPELFWSVSAGCVDSMVANYTATGKFRKDDDFTPGGFNDRRPDRACIAYANLIRRYSKGKLIVLGGIEASLRRVAHYDYWSDKVRRSVLFDAKADAITYGMAELANLELASCLRDGRDWHSICGLCYADHKAPAGYLEMPSFENCANDTRKFGRAFRLFYENCDPLTAKGLYQAHGDRLLVQNPPARLLTQTELDRVYELDYENTVHPYYAKDGIVKALDTVKNSLTSHRGCYGECSFCAIAVHQGRTVVSRSEDSLVRETERIAARPGFNGIIYDVGGPTANMYGIECPKKLKQGACKDRKCLWPRPCPSLPLDHSRQIALLERLRAVPGVKRVFVTSGIRYDMVVFDKKAGRRYTECLAAHHISGQLKIAPEHVSAEVLELMGKPDSNVLLDFKDQFDETNRKMNKEQFLTYYFMAAAPGCGDRDMQELDRFVHTELKTNPEQVQIFTPTPSTVATLEYWTRRDYYDRHNVWTEHSNPRKQAQKDIITGHHRADRRFPSDRNGDCGRPRTRTAAGRRLFCLLQRIRFPLDPAWPATRSARFRLSSGRARCSPERLRDRHSRLYMLQAEPLRPGLSGVCNFGHLHSGKTPGLPAAQPESDPHRPGSDTESLRCRPADHGPRTHRPSRPRQRLSVLDGRAHLPPARLLFDHDAGGGNLQRLRQRERARICIGLRRLPRMPASAPRLPAVRAPPSRCRVPPAGTSISGMADRREHSEESGSVLKYLKSYKIEKN